MSLYFNNELRRSRVPQRVQPEEFHQWLQPRNCEIGWQHFNVRSGEQRETPSMEVAILTRSAIALADLLP